MARIRIQSVSGHNIRSCIRLSSRSRVQLSILSYFVQFQIVFLGTPEKTIIMDLFINNSIFSEESESNDFLNTSFIDFNKNAAVTVRRKNAVRLLSMLQWFSKCSAIEKSNYLLRLANELSLDDLVEVIKPIKLFFGKPFMLDEATNGTICIDDKVLNDDNINLAAKILKEVQESDFRWFYNLERVDQVEVIVGLTKILGVGSCRKLYQRLLTMYCVKHKEEAQIIADIAEAATPALIQGGGSGGGQHVGSDDLSASDYAAAAGDVHVTVLNLRTNWTRLINRYRYEVFGKAMEKLQQPQQKQVESTGAEPHHHAASNSRKQARQTADNQRLDQLQLLPLYISWKILGYLDNKTLATVQQVNTYWLFACRQVWNERAARISLDKMGKRLQQQQSTSVTSSGRSDAEAAAVRRRCDIRLQQLFERGTALPSVRHPTDNLAFASSLLQDVFEQAHFPHGSFVLPTEGLCVFPRCPPPHLDEVFAGNECVAQWLEGAGPNHLVCRRPIVERQVAVAPLGRKVAASTTRQSTESLDHTKVWHTDDESAAAAVAHHRRSTYTNTTELYEEQQGPWHSSVMVTAPPPPHEDNVLSDLASTTRMRVAPRGGDDTTRPDAEAVLRTFEQRISGYTSRSRVIAS